MSIGSQIVVCVAFAVLGQALSQAVVGNEFISIPGLKTSARTVRKLVHDANWTTLATISANSSNHDFPMISVVAVADSTAGGKATGNIYFYLSSDSFESKNVNKVNNVTALFVQDDEINCKSQDKDSLQLSCPQAVISGYVMQLYTGSKEYKTGQDAVLSRHPASMKNLQKQNYYLCQLVVQTVMLIDSKGVHNVNLKDYLNDKIFGIIP